ncbi:glutamate receptor 3-like [Saccostrea echinata]|uniref:glutamate receptor 3-like n=1 Tax=Saccostrea echinata TaxID=191078 RepID=UPI002A82D7F8|nr:glutamate receptor 3-like [Saccostrea echinata]
MKIHVLCLFLLLGLTTTSSEKTVYKVTTILNKPFVTQKVGNPSEFQGLIPDLLKRIEPIINVTFDIKHVGDFKYGYQDRDGNWTGMIGELVKGVADIAAASITVTAERATAIDFSHPFMESGISIVLKRPIARGWQAIKGYVSFLEPFTVGVWIALLFSCLIIPILYGLIMHFDPMEDEAETSFLKNIARAVPVVFYRFCLQGSLAPSKSTSRAARVVLAFWSLFLIILYATWASAFAVFIMEGKRQLPESPLHSFSELSKQTSVKFGTVKAGSTYRYFTNALDEVDSQIGQHLKNNPDQLVKSTEDGIKRVRNSNGDYAFITEEIGARLIAGQLPCDLMLIHHSFIRKSFSFGCAKNTSTCRNLDIAIIKLKTDGVIQELIDKWLNEDDVCDTDFYDDYLLYIKSFNSKKDESGYLFKGSALGMDKVGSVYVLLAIGIVLSVCLLVFDICTERRVQKAVSRRGGTDKQPFEAITDDMQ